MYVYIMHACVYECACVCVCVCVCARYIMLYEHCVNHINNLT